MQYISKIFLNIATGQLLNFFKKTFKFSNCTLGRNIFFFPFYSFFFSRLVQESEPPPMGTSVVQVVQLPVVGLQVEESPMMGKSEVQLLVVEKPNEELSDLEVGMPNGELLEGECQVREWQGRSCGRGSCQTELQRRGR